MIYYKKGNLLECTEAIIIHQVNCQGKMNAGVAKIIREAYPKVYTDYLELEASSTLLGCVQYVEVDNKIVVNLFGQDNYRPRTVRHTSYDALDEGFRKIKNVLNPSHICNNCVIAYQIIDWIDTEADYYKLLEEIKNQ